MTERALDLGHKCRECFAAFLQGHFTEEIDGQTTLAKMSKKFLNISLFQQYGM
jgi:hypothetical protein